MKLLKKLIPLGIVATAATAVVPMAVSCGEKEFNGITDPNFQPDEKHKEVDFDYAQDAMLEYANNVKENPNILIQDFYWTIAQEALQTEKEDKETEGYKDGSVSFSVEASNVSLKVVCGPVLTNYFLLSADLEYKLHDDFNAVIDKDEERHVYDESSKISFRNIPIFVTYNSTAEQEWKKWRFTFDNDHIHNIRQLNNITTDYKYVIDYSYHSVDTSLTDGEIINEVEDISNESKSIDKNNIIFDDFVYDIEAINFNSYYLIDCSI